MPRRGKHSIVISARTDIRILAGVLTYYQQSTVKTPTSRSQLIRYIIEDFHEILLLNGSARRITKASEALEILSNSGIESPVANRSARRALLSQIDEECYSPQPEVITPEEITEALGRLKKQEKEP